MATANGSSAGVKELPRKSVTADGSSGFKAEAGRYHIYIAHGCPFAHRTAIMRSLKGLEDTITLSPVDDLLDDDGWKFSEDKNSEFADPINGFTRFKQVYEQTEPHYTGRYTVPVLYDKKTKTIVNNESPEIIRMLNSEFHEFSKTKVDFYPPALRAAIDQTNDWVNPSINNGVYKCGFAPNQESYEQVCKDLFAAFDKLEAILSKQRYAASNDLITEADVRLIPTLLRFDVAYYILYKANLKRIVDYPNIWAYLRELYQHPLIRPTVNFQQIKLLYYKAPRSVKLNPNLFVPLGPAIDWDAPHDRNRIGQSK